MKAKSVEVAKESPALGFEINESKIEGDFLLKKGDDGDVTDSDSEKGRLFFKKLFGLEAGPGKMSGTAFKESIKRFFKVVMVKRREFESFGLREDLVVGKALAVDLTLTDAGRRKDLAI
jgi:hypothetical protein